jgi:predicted TPR repeat methyltransferase
MWNKILSFYQRIAARRMFARWHQSYEFDVMDNHYSAANKVAQATIRYIAASTKDGAPGFLEEPDIVDVGIGTGLLAEQLQDSLPCRIIGLDFTDDMMTICAQKGVAELLIKCDAGRDVWPLQERSMDMVVSAGLFEYLTGTMAQHFLKETHRVLQDNGILVFTYLPRQSDEKSTSLWRGHSGTFVICAYTPEEMDRMLKEQKLVLLEHSSPFKGSIYEDGSSYDYRLIVAKKT